MSARDNIIEQLRLIAGTYPPDSEERAILARCIRWLVANIPGDK